MLLSRHGQQWQLLLRLPAGRQVAPVYCNALVRLKQTTGNSVYTRLAADATIRYGSTG